MHWNIIDSLIGGPDAGRLSVEMKSTRRYVSVFTCTMYSVRSMFVARGEDRRSNYLRGTIVQESYVDVG